MAFQQDAGHLGTVDDEVVGPFQRQPRRRERGHATDGVVQREPGDEA
jgi:hypothetical protein